MARTSADSALNLRAGELVKIRSEREILATLDETGALDGLPFMPEMLAYCGRTVPVYKRADKTCDTIERTGGRRMTDTVHLADLRCDGQAHGGCQAGCLLFWKEAWLERASTERVGGGGSAGSCPPALARSQLTSATCVENDDPAVGEVRYRCQATELLRASSPLAWWNLGQYVRDLRSGNVTVREVMRGFGFWLFRQTLKVGGYRLLIGLYDAFQRQVGGRPYPFKSGSLAKTPRATLDLAEGELVQVKSHDEILQTLNASNRNHGLRFDAEMVRFCGGTYRVRKRVERIIDERTGHMLKLSRDCIILDGVVCPGAVSAKRMFCPRSIFPYWREIWLRRVEGDDAERDRAAGACGR